MYNPVTKDKIQNHNKINQRDDNFFEPNIKLFPLTLFSVSLLLRYYEYY